MHTVVTVSLFPLFLPPSPPPPPPTHTPLFPPKSNLDRSRLPERVRHSKLWCKVIRWKPTKQKAIYPYQTHTTGIMWYVHTVDYVKHRSNSICCSFSSTESLQVQTSYCSRSLYNGVFFLPFFFFFFFFFFFLRVGGRAFFR